jgi:hypothetical protein
MTRSNLMIVCSRERVDALFLFGLRVAELIAGVSARNVASSRVFLAGMQGVDEMGRSAPRARDRPRRRLDAAGARLREWAAVPDREAGRDDGDDDEA